MAQGKNAHWFEETSGNYFDDAKNGSVWDAINRSKQYELLHMQLVRKAQKIDPLANTGGVSIRADYLLTNKGLIYFIKNYYVYTGGVQPYTYEGRLNLGLSQLFNGQNPKEKFSGDYSSGITNDTQWLIVGEKVYTEQVIPPTKYGKIIDSGSGRFKIAETNCGDGVLWGRDDWFFTDKGFIVRHRHFKTHSNSFVAPAFWANNNMFVGGKKYFIEHWNEIFTATYYPKKNKKKSSNPFKRFMQSLKSNIPILATAALTYFSFGALSSIGSLVSWSGMAAIGGIIGSIGMSISLFGHYFGSNSIVKFGSYVGYIGSAISAVGAIGGALQTIGTTAKGTASTLPNQNIAHSQGANQTADLYNAISPTARDTLTNSQLYLTNSLKIAGYGMQAVQSIRNLSDAFRSPNQYQDDDMQEISDEKKL
ncbi:hypothetical protein KDE13_07425 [Campylobacter sp. faydin G-140]|uniref:hypothetical protein n=1 Tax=Campylobacter anatolicus TaxID=2829105 RepID=UPI001BA0C9BD|nr:hypothetical protein [Campylobacter anatolicus]MBR8466167.1 hypothetical protein [Campylobacter anatolicus]